MIYLYLKIVNNDVLCIALAKWVSQEDIKPDVLFDPMHLANKC